MNHQHEPFHSLNLDLVDALATAVILLDRRIRVVKANAAAQSLISKSETMVRGHPLAEVFPGADELVGAARRALDESRSFIERDLALPSSKLKHATVNCTLTPLWEGDAKPEFVVVEIIDADRHPRVRLEGNLLMQNEVSSTLLRGLAHEIKNPLGGIRGAAQLLERELEDRKQEEYTQIIIGEADRLRMLVDRMLGPFGEPKKIPLNIHDVLEHVRQLVEAERECSVLCKRDYDPSLPALYADRDQLIQAFLNLVRNAMQAVNNGTGRITLHTRVERQFTIRSTLHRLVVLAQIIDSGPGVDPEIASSIFFPLVSGRSGGSGLGLPIAQSLVHRQGGLISFESEPGRTEFSVWLPVGELP